jgi:hypothetical protein
MLTERRVPFEFIIHSFASHLLTMPLWKSSKSKTPKAPKSSSKDPEIIRWPSFSTHPRAPVGYSNGYHREYISAPLPLSGSSPNIPLKITVPGATAVNARTRTTTNVRTQYPSRLKPLPSLPVTPPPSYETQVQAHPSDRPLFAEPASLSRSRAKNGRREHIPSNSRVPRSIEDTTSRAIVAQPARVDSGSDADEHSSTLGLSFEGMSDPMLARAVRKEALKMKRIKEGKASKPRMGPREKPAHAPTPRWI